MTKLRDSIIGSAGIGRLALKREVWKRLLAGFTAILLFGGATALADLNAGLVAHYPLDGNGTNILGTGNDGVLTGVIPGSDRLGNASGACYFNGTATLDMPSGPPISPTSSVTYAFWLISTYDGYYFSSDPTTWYWLWWVDRTSGPGAASLFSLALMLEPYGQFWFRPRTDDWSWPTNWRALTGGQLTPQTWQHIAMVRDYGNAFRLYVNGVLVASDWDNSSPLTLPPIRLGKHASDSQMGLIGKMDDLRIYDRALSEAEIQELGCDGCRPTYTQDFSSDPGWTTDDPVKLQWDSAARTFHGTQVNTEGTYAYANLPTFNPNQSWQLQVDHKVNACEWSAGITFGLFDSSLLYGHGMSMDVGIADVGNLVSLVTSGSGPSSHAPAWLVGVWYHDVFTYDATTHELTLTVRVRDTGALFTTLASTVSSFPADMMRLGVSRLHMKGSPPGASPTASVDYELDNISLCQVQAGPTNRPPTVTCPPATTVDCGGTMELTAAVSDPDGDAMVVVWALNGTAIQTNLVAAGSPGASVNVTLSGSFPTGTNILALGVTDGANAASCATTVIVADTKAPVISSVVAAPNVLWPPNHKMVSVNVQAAVNDACSAATWKIVRVWSDEPLNGWDDRKSLGDWRLIDDHTLLLRAERSGKGGARIYYIAVQATDAAGNASQTQTVTVTAPKSQGKAKR